LFRINPITAVLVLAPIFCYTRSHAAKARLDLESWDGWKVWHFFWHLSGSLLSLVIMKVVHSCEARSEAEQAEPLSFEPMCQSR
jgi:hypothetical protein